MDPGFLLIRPGTWHDLPGIVKILNDTAETSNATFSTRPTTVEERHEWMEQFSSTGPYRLFVAWLGDAMGFACSQRYRSHEAFRQTVEVSIALDAGCRGRGVGTRLYQHLFAALAGEAVHVALAGIALPNDASVALHRRFGFVEVGAFREYAVKNGQYISSMWMQRLEQATDGRRPYQIDP